MEEQEKIAKQNLSEGANEEVSENWVERLSMKFKGRSHDMVRLGLVITIFEIFVFLIWVPCILVSSYEF